MRKENSEFKTKFISESGSYLRNADYFAFVELKDYACYCIADGIDTDERKESAKTAVTAVITAFTEDPGISKGKLRNYIKTAHHVLLEEATEIRLEASIVVVISDYKKIRWGHAGNTRLTFMRNGNIRFRTKDMSLSQNLADKSEIPLDQLESHEERHNLYGYLGQAGHFNPVIARKRSLEDGDVIFLYTRGIWETIGDAEFLDAMDGASDPEVVCAGLEDIVLSQQQRVLENYTIATIFVNKVYRNPKAGKIKKITKIIVMIAMVAVMITAGILFARYRSNKKNAEQMKKYEARGISYINEINYTSADEQFDEAVELADKIKTGKRSELYREVKKIEIYDKMTGYLTEGTTALTEEEYKKAANKFDAALDEMQKLKDDYKEDISYKADIVAYKTFSQGMKSGMDAMEAGDFETASTELTKASEAADSIDDTTNRNVADENLKTTNGQKAMAAGAKYEASGDDNVGQSIYSQALTDYNAALEMYNLAKEQYGVSDAADKASMVNVKIDNVNDTVNQQTTQQQEAEADNLVQKGNDALHSGDYDTAESCYNNAKNIYQKTNNTAQVVAMNEKIDSAAYGPDENNALQNVLDACSALANNDLGTAISKIDAAKSAYTNLGDTATASALGNLLNTLNQTAAAQQ